MNRISFLNRGYAFKGLLAVGLSFRAKKEYKTGGVQIKPCC